MALVAASKIHNFAQIGLRTLTTKTANVKKTVFISQSTDIFTNLAFEEWLYRNWNFTNQQILVLWRNDPCVIIGRHQNPWVETNVSHLPFITDSGVQLARRCSGGGTFYQDQGNVNATFFTTNYRSNHKHNLEVIIRAIFREYGLKLDISPKENLCLRNSKVSVSAARMGPLNAYHQCALSVNVDKMNLNRALRKFNSGVKSNAPRSTKSKILNLCEENPKINVKGLLSAIGWEYMRTPVNSLKDGGKYLANLQNGFQMVNPTEQWFPGLNAIRENLCSWDWCYGKTPKFTITKFFPVPDQFTNSYNGISGDLSIRMVVEQGRVTDVSLYVPQGLSNSGLSGEANVITSLKNHKFTEDALNSFEWSLCGCDSNLGDDKDKFISECVRQVMTSV
ncbi:hypothetical protein RN001_015669 [Aquatica leii]|uniref:BPL/LPL catalytic domain-containing protein n=1 Tax=Aquatica leii TaxID=1421715 RepID=A0AAN7SMR4_9COLE|nr:hypothetical protein RN001_015669 [Aquatica leii]